MKPKFVAAVCAISLIGAVLPAVTLATPKPPTTSVTWTGNGTTVGEDTRTLNTSICDTANGAPVDGNYLLFVLASTKSISSAFIDFGSGQVSMDKSNGTKAGTSSYKKVYTGPDFDLDDLLDNPVVATWTGSGSPTLTLSHGCIETDEVDVTGLSAISELTSGCGSALCYAADGNDDELAYEGFIDIHNLYGFPGVLGIPLEGFDPSLMTAVVLKKNDGTLVETCPFDYEGAVIAYCDNTFVSSTLIRANPSLTPITPPLEDADFFEVTYNGNPYRFALIVD